MEISIGTDVNKVKLPVEGARFIMAHMERYICLKCFHDWQPRTAENKDWKRRKCPSCGSRQTIKMTMYDRAVDDFTEALRTLPASEHNKILQSALTLGNAMGETLYDAALPPRVVMNIYETAKRRLIK